MDDRDAVLGDDGMAPPPGARGRLPAALRSPATAVVGAVALAFAVGAGAGLLRDGGEPSAQPVASASPSPSPSSSPPTAEPSAATTSAAPTPAPSSDPELDPSCATDAAHVAVCRFVRALQTDDVSGLTEGERQLADVDDDLPDAAFSVASCELEGDVTVLCEVAFADEARTSAGFRLQPSNGEYDAETGQVVVAPGEELAYEVVEAVGLRRDGEQPVAPPPDPGAPAAAELVLGGDDLGATKVGASAEEALAAVSRVLGPPLADPSPTTACVGSGEREVEWRAFRLAVTDGVVSGWLSGDPRLRTPSDLGIGSTVADLRRVLGDGVQLFEPSPDTSAGFTVDEVELGGSLTATSPDGQITVFWNGACAPP